MLVDSVNVVCFLFSVAVAFCRNIGILRIKISSHNYYITFHTEMTSIKIEKFFFFAVRVYFSV